MILYAVQCTQETSHFHTDTVLRDVNALEIYAYDDNYLDIYILAVLEFCAFYWIKFCSRRLVS